MKIEGKDGEWEEVKVTTQSEDYYARNNTIQISGPWPGTENLLVFKRKKDCPQLLRGDAVWVEGETTTYVVLGIQCVEPISYRGVNTIGLSVTISLDKVTQVFRSGNRIWSRS